MLGRTPTLALAFVVVACVASGQPARGLSLKTHDLKLSIAVEEVPWARGKRITLPYSIENQFSSSFRGCVMKDAEWANSFSSGDYENVVPLLDPTECQAEFTLKPGGRISGTVTIRGSARTPRELQPTLSVLELPARRDLEGRLKLIRLRSQPVPYAIPGGEKP